MAQRTESEIKRLRIEVKGVVQGVGFRPFVYHLARSNRLNGYVMNSSSGVVIEVEGAATDAFMASFRRTPPPLARIMSVHTEELSLRGDGDFQIRPSLNLGESTQVSPDASICDDCLSEMLDPGDRRYLYPFINCTNCGPRYTITRAVPYDRPNTTMSPFLMCPACLKEYENPADRRFHAQPNACSLCGPQVLFLRDGRQETGREAVNATIRALKEGLIVAVKGLGGFHLAVDAENAEAVERLRRRKRKNNKAFALMAPDMEHVRRYCRLSPEEEAFLLSRERPILLLRRREDVRMHEQVAPGAPDLGFMLPYTPLHVLLFRQPQEGNPGQCPNFRALIMTSGNMSEEPIIKENAGAAEKLSPLADAFLFHDREIFMRVDDSVVRLDGGRPRFIRRARGYVPVSIFLGEDGPEVLACGADLKNTFTLTQGDSAIVSQHIGDMENLETLEFFEETLNNLKEVYRISPRAIAHDLHPGYFSTRWALEQTGVLRVAIQHHYAHIGSVMAEQGIRKKVIGVALDGTGYGTDGTIWGGEFLVADLRGFERAASFKPIPLPGGEAAVKAPWVMAVSYVKDLFGSDALSYLDALGFLGKFGARTVGNVLKLTENPGLSPQTSSAGRLFDAVSSLLGLRDSNTYEGEAAMALESGASSGRHGRYPFRISEGAHPEIDFSETLTALIQDRIEKRDAGAIAAMFHNTVAQAVCDMVIRISEATGIRQVVLSGGVFQNRLILKEVMEALCRRGLRPCTNEKVPCNDGGVSLGQAYLLRERMKKGDGEIR